jgi:hypothetical protein
VKGVVEDDEDEDVKEKVFIIFGVDRLTEVI